MAGWCLVLLLVVALTGTRAWADGGSGRADALCAKAATAERDAREAERKSEERQRFLKGKGGTNSRYDTASTVPNGGDSAISRQSVQARLSEVRALLPQLRQGAAAAANDRGVVPGLSQYFSQLENNLSRLIQAADACLGAPQFCSMPPIFCPPMPAMPSFGNSGNAAFTRQVQQSYVQSANQLRQACQNLNAGIVGDVERLKRESRPAGPTIGPPGIAPPKPFADTDLYLRRAENLRREASYSRQEADRVSGVRGYCGAKSYVRGDAKPSRAVVESLKAAERRRKSEADFPLDGKVIDLKMEWEKKWDKGSALHASDVPLPKVQAGGSGDPVPSRSGDDPEGSGPSWWDKWKTEYRKADEEMELTEFIKSRPKELLKDVVTEIVEKSLGAYGKTVTTGYKIMSAVKTTGDEVGEILTDAPRVLAIGSMDEARELYVRAERVPLNFLNNIFDDVTGKFPPPRYRYKYKGGGGE